MQFSERVIKVTWLIFASFIAKIVVEVLHEGGHFFVAFLTNGYVEEVYISLLWPYESSYVIANVKGFYAKLLFAAAGITVVIFFCFIATFIVMPKIRGIDRKFLVVVYPFLVWFSFWSFLNALGYMVLGSFKPFGDIKAIITMLKIDSIYFLPLAIILAVPLIVRISDENAKMMEMLFPSLTGKKWVDPLIWIFAVPATLLVMIPGGSYNFNGNIVFFLLLLLVSFLPFLFSTLIYYVFRD